jgi:3-mercaptopyruvate sulfurtransferase SseA
MAQRMIEEWGFDKDKVFALKDGWKGWEKAGLPTAAKP